MPKPAKKSKNGTAEIHLDKIITAPPDPAMVITKYDDEVREVVKTMTVDEVRFLVDAYYEMQKSRIRSSNQIDSIERGQDAGPNKALAWIAGNAEAMEKHTVKLLLVFAENQHMGRWALAVHGIGPVIAAGLLAYVDQTKPTAGHIWSYFGYNPEAVWLGRDAAKKWVNEQPFPVEEILDLACTVHHAKRDVLLKFATSDKDGNPSELTKDSLARALARRPWNAALKTLGFKIGESFIKTSNSEKGIYGHIFKERKLYEERKNEEGAYAAQAQIMLKRAPAHVQKAWYSGCYTVEAYRKIRMEPDQAKRAKLERDLRGTPGSGIHMLPLSHLLSRARRYAVKRFLADWHQEAYRNHFGTEPPLPYPVAILGHAHFSKTASVPGPTAVAA